MSEETEPAEPLTVQPPSRRPKIGPDDIVTRVDGPADQPAEPWAPTEKPHRTSRRKARKYALDLLYAAELRGIDPVGLLDEPWTVEATVPALTRDLVQGVAAQAAIIDQIIAQHLPSGWSLPRMPRLDRQLARLATYELNWTLTPAEVVVAEAVGLANELSTDESPGFLSGLLGAIVADLA